jgi:type II secretory pathway component PulC
MRASNGGRALLAALVSLSVGLAAACGGSAPAKVQTAASAQTARPAASAPAAPAPLPANALRRSAVHDALRMGLGAFLQRVELDETPVFVGTKFHGFKVAALTGDPAFWRGVDLKPGDVITHVNGYSVEHPEDALEAFKSLDVASELKVEYERNGVARELKYTIVDDEPPAAKQADASAR